MFQICFGFFGGISESFRRWFVPINKALDIYTLNVCNTAEKGSEMNGKDLMKKLLAEGWKLEGIHGSHHFLTKDGKRINIPLHGTKDLAKGTLNQILKEAGLK